MPRHTLDKWTYKLKTIDVCITQHKEDDIYNHMVKMHDRIQELYKKYRAKYDQIINIELDSETNMYKTYNWRQGDPSRFWKKNADSWYAVDVPEQDRELVEAEWFQIYQIWADFKICDNPEYHNDWLYEKEDWKDMVHETDKIHGFMKNSYETITLYEYMAYEEAKREWKQKDKDWIEEQERKKEHKKHPLIQLPSVTNLDVEPELYPSQPLRDDCMYCKQHWEEMKPKYELAIQIWSKNKQEEIEWENQTKLEDEKIRKERERKTKEYEQWSAKQEPVDLHCHECEYKAKNVRDLENHNESEQHKKKLIYCKVCSLQCRSEYDYNNHISSQKHCKKEEDLKRDTDSEKKARYCEVCEIQCRNAKEYEHHLDTTKHKKNAGLIEKVKVYKCSKCDYQTTIKCNYEKHIVNKKHQEV